MNAKNQIVLQGLEQVVQRATTGCLNQPTQEADTALRMVEEDHDPQVPTLLHTPLRTQGVRAPHRLVAAERVLTGIMEAARVNQLLIPLLHPILHQVADNVVLVTIGMAAPA